jgi:hypothetical protein
MHPLTPIPLLLIARFCQAHAGQNEAYGLIIPGIAAALQDSTHLNRLAQNSLQMLGFDYAVPRADGFPNTSCHGDLI